MADFDGKVALVTGGNSGIGLATAMMFAEQGARVVVAARRKPEGEQTVAAIRAAGGEALFVQTDVTRPTEVEAMVSTAVGAYGRLDYAFNNAGGSFGPGPLHESSLDDWDRTMEVNLKGVYLCMRYEIAQMLSLGAGAIVNDSSTAGLYGYARNPIYAASKFGVVGLTKSAALQYAAQGIRVNAVCPGWIRTPMTEENLTTDTELRAQMLAETPLGRAGMPDEIAGMVLWLCSDAASFVTGQAIAIDGGLVAQ
ncbi:MAG: SDR family oxidoreductase [Chloroflexi bacterium]|nr:SDR family oxidoreductase [Chloroflexota bacterium]